MSDPSLDLLQTMVKDVLYMLANQAIEIRELRLDAETVIKMREQLDRLEERVDRIERRLDPKDG